jgi:hypothetical protein
MGFPHRTEAAAFLWVAHQVCVDYYMRRWSPAEVFDSLKCGYESLIRYLKVLEYWAFEECSIEYLGRNCRPRGACSKELV